MSRNNDILRRRGIDLMRSWREDWNRFVRDGLGVTLDREYLAAVLRETVTGPDMEHIPYPVTEDMIFEAMREVEELGE